MHRNDKANAKNIFIQVQFSISNTTKVIEIENRKLMILIQNHNRQ